MTQRPTPQKDEIFEDLCVMTNAAHHAFSMRISWYTVVYCGLHHWSHLWLAGGAGVAGVERPSTPAPTVTRRLQHPATDLLARVGAAEREGRVRGERFGKGGGGGGDWNGFDRCQIDRVDRQTAESGIKSMTRPVQCHVNKTKTGFVSRHSREEVEEVEEDENLSSGIMANFVQQNLSIAT
ncbi:hypothetical protein RRG08_026697 [Elysia crispata]|uniref:Uncharacterized protein n=1 Tax=Elysia crispata TaxID=231223 RepID=A0AAE1CMQ0_9GAST|nr:hypothetical protein RRG08_026697 [Elysia crispata]